MQIIVIGAAINSITAIDLLNILLMDSLSFDMFSENAGLRALEKYDPIKAVTSSIL